MGNVLVHRKVCVGDIRKWTQECDVGMGPFIVIDIGKWKQVGERISPILDDVATVMYSDGSTRNHLLEGMDEDTQVVEG